MANDTRLRLISRISSFGAFDPVFHRSGAAAIMSYAEWLSDLSDDDLLDAVERVSE